MTLTQAFDRYRLEVLPTLAPRTARDYVRHLNVLERTFGHLDADALKPKDIGAFLDRPKGKIQANRQVAVLSAVYAKLVGRWYQAERNPCRDVERNPSKRRTRYVTDAEYAAVHELASPRLALAMDLALLTGQRQGDLLLLPFKNVTDDGILFRQGKTGKRLLVGMTPTLLAVIDRARVMQPIGETVIRTRQGLSYTSEGFRAMYQRLMRRAVRKGVITERFCFHDLRAKSASDSSSINQAYERLGHTSMSMTRSVYDRGVRKVTALR